MMDPIPDDELTSDEQAQFARLARDLDPDEVAEARTVHALRARGLLRRTWPRAMRRAAIVAAACAAGMALFLGGIAYGRHVATSEVRTTSPALQLQRAGSDYVKAVQRLTDAVPTGATPVLLQGLETGTATLRAAAATLAQVGPRDSSTRALRARLDAAAFALGNDNITDGRAVVWF